MCMSLHLMTVYAVIYDPRIPIRQNALVYSHVSYVYATRSCIINIVC